MKWLENNQYALAGAVLGLLIALPILTLGLFKTVLLLIFIILGIVVGNQFKGSGILEKYLEKIQGLRHK